jgi:hypothetical protein
MGYHVADAATRTLQRKYKYVRTVQAPEATSLLACIAFRSEPTDALTVNTLPPAHKEYALSGLV